jgi:hypothetical protein
MLEGNLFLEFLEPGFGCVGGDIRVGIMNRKLKQSGIQEAAFDGAGLGAREKSGVGCDVENFQTMLLPRQSNRNIQLMFTGPCDQLFRRVTPTQAEGGLQQSLSLSGMHHQEQTGGEHGHHGEMLEHERHLHGFRINRKTRYGRAGSILVEAGLSLGLLTFIGLMLLKMSLNILTPRQWGLQQTVTDAYMTYERALAERIPFADLLASGSPWPAYSAVRTESVELGRLPGNRPIFGTITRTRVPSTNNFPIDGGTGTTTTNPAAMQVWKVQSIATYTIGGRNYAKSRTILRSQ